MPEPLKEIAAQLRSTLGRLELALALVDDCLVWTDHSGRIIWCNAAFDRLIRKPHIEILGLRLEDLLPFEQPGQPISPDDRPASLVESERSESVGTLETTLDGERVVFDLYAHRRALPKAQETVFVLHDNTERVRAEEHMRALNAQLEAFSYSVSHDLRTPLRAIDGFSQALLEDYGDKLDEEGVDNLHRIRAAAQTMGHLIEDMLKLSGLTRTELRREQVDLSELARSIDRDLRSRSPDRHVEFLLRDGLVVEGDEHLLAQVLENLLENAWKFTAKVPHARIELGGAQNQEVVFFVRDNGAGFDMATADRLFGAFQRLHTAEEFPGTGIGLAIVRRIAHRHGGRTWAEGEVGTGATFYVALPRGEDPPIGEGKEG